MYAWAEGLDSRIQSPANVLSIRKKMFGKGDVEARQNMSALTCFACCHWQTLPDACDITEEGPSASMAHLL